MTQSQTIPYSHDLFHETIPSIRAAIQTLNRRFAQTFITETLGPLIRKHDVQESFGVGLVHRHFDIKEDEILVEFNNISSAWSVSPPDATEAVSDDKSSTEPKPGYPPPATREVVGVSDIGDKLYPVAWKIVTTSSGADKWMPYEFAWRPQSQTPAHIVDITSPKYASFLTEYTAALKSKGMHDILGLRAWPGNDFKGTIEITVGKLNINLVEGQFEEWLKSPKMVYSRTMWFMVDGFYRDCYCRWVDSDGHCHFTTQGDINLA